MIIRDLKSSKSVELLEIDVGEVFEYEGLYYLKISENCSTDNVLLIEDRILVNIGNGVYVNHVPSELILHESGWEKKDV